VKIKDYTTASGTSRQVADARNQLTVEYTTDIVAIDTSGTNWLLETKGRQLRRNIGPANMVLVTILGITDKSFADPGMRCSASIPGDPNYFNERLRASAPRGKT